jgi:hypothetical protein
MHVFGAKMQLFITIACFITLEVAIINKNVLDTLQYGLYPSVGPNVFYNSPLRKFH